MNRLCILLLFLLLRGPADAASTPLRLPAAPRIVAIGDLHGDLDATRRAFRLAGAIDEHDRWIGGSLVVVQTGDVLDRGDDEREILDLFERWQDDATHAGGGFYPLNGNHELMNAAADLRYITAGGYRDFRGETPAARGDVDSTLGEYLKSVRARIAAFSPGGAYARVLAKRNVVLIIGDNVFVHGGVLPEHVTYGLDRANTEAQAWLRGEGPKPEGLLKRGSLVWARDYSQEPDGDDCKKLQVVLDALAAKRMIVGHTPHEDIVPYCDERVWCIDTGMSAAYGGPTRVLEITGDTVRVLQ
ncbi:MAG TPA: metallophosphoesterase [Candidatus Krumholzibacteria bacterium]